MGFSTPSYDLNDLFARIDRGDIQLPDFQRSYAWDEDRIRSLIVTVLRGYPLGAFMALDTRNEAMRFRPRPLAGAPDTGVNPGLLLLDGQQRLTTLYHCFRCEGFVDTTDFRSKKVSRKYYVDLRKATSEDIMPDEAVFAVDQHGELRSHFAPDIDGSLNSREAAVQECCIPVSALLSEEGTSMLFELAAANDGATRDVVAAFNNRILRPLSGYTVPMIRLSRETASAGIGSIFAQANSAGLQMDVFDLLTAVFASEDPEFHLAEDWAGVEKQLRAFPALDGIGRNEFLSAVSLLVSGEKGNAGGQREDILQLSLAEYRKAAQTLVITFREVAEFLAERCILSLEQVPYSEQIIPLAVILARLTQRSGVLASQEAWDRLNQWFWSGVFGELYGSSAVKLRAARDVDEVTAWVAGDTEDVPKTVRDASFRESRLLSVGENDGVWHGLYALLMARGAKDWRTGRAFNRHSFEELQPGFFPVFPLRWCERHGISGVLAHSVLNRTPMGKRTEVVLDGHSPERYLPRVQSKSIMEDAEFDSVLASHDLDPQLLTAKTAHQFFADRRERFVGIVEYALNKQVVRDVDEANLSGGEEARRPLRIKVSPLAGMPALSVAALLVMTALGAAGCSSLGRGEPILTQDITALPEADIDVDRASEENRLRLIDPQFANEVTVVGDRWGVDSARLFFKESNTLILAEETDAAALRAATLSVSQRVPMVTYDASIRPQISQLLTDLEVDQILVIGDVPWASQNGQREVIHDPGNTKALGEYTAFRFDSKVVMNPERMVDNIARLDSSTKTELKAAWEPLPQHITKEKMPAIPAQARRDAQMAPVIVATAESPIANVVNATAYGGTVFVMPEPDPTATKAGAAITAGLSEGPIVALGPEFGSVTEFTHKIAQGWTE